MSDPLDSLKALRTEASEDCVSDFAMDRLLVGELVQEEAAALRGRIRACPHCQARLDELREEQRAFSARPIPIHLGRRRSSTVRAAVALVAAAAAAALFVQLPVTDDGVIRTKGGAWAGYTVVAPDGAVRGDQDSGLAYPGDELQWNVHIDEPRYAAVLSRDPTGNVSVYFPDSNVAALVSPRDGRTQTLRLAARLDGLLGEEDLFILLCETPVQLAPLLAELRDNTESFPAECTVSEHILLKKASP
ncbi:MAG: hypothetical protein WBG86_05635 [Polyangiales bacterium]